MFCALLTSRYQVSVYRTNGPLVFFSDNLSLFFFFFFSLRFCWKISTFDIGNLNCEGGNHLTVCVCVCVCVCVFVCVRACMRVFV